MRDLDKVKKYLITRRIAIKAQLRELDRLEDELFKKEGVTISSITPDIQSDILFVIQTRHSILIPGTSRSIAKALRNQKKYQKNKFTTFRKLVAANLKRMRENRDAFPDLNWTKHKVAEHRGHEFHYFTSIV